MHFRRLDSRQNTHKIFFKCPYMICLAIKYHLVMKDPLVLPLKFEYFAIYLNTEFFI